MSYFFDFIVTLADFSFLLRVSRERGSEGEREMTCTGDLSLGFLGAVVLHKGRHRNKRDEEPKFMRVEVEHCKRTGM